MPDPIHLRPLVIDLGSKIQGNVSVGNCERLDPCISRTSLWPPDQIVKCGSEIVPDVIDMNDAFKLRSWPFFLREGLLIQ